jgi:hypothetical protein
LPARPADQSSAAPNWADRRRVSLFYLENLPAGARIRVTLDGTNLPDAFGRLVDVDGDGQPGGRTNFFFDTFSATPLAATAVIGRVFASEPESGGQPGVFVNRPLAGVTITVDGAEETLRTTTDASGFFKLQPAPAGRFFVHVDGRTAQGSRWPTGDYYPVVGKAWDAVAGREDNLAAGTGEIFLPLIRAGTLQPVSATQDTPVTFPPEVVQQNPALKDVVWWCPPTRCSPTTATAAAAWALRRCRRTACPSPCRPVWPCRWSSPSRPMAR